MTKEWICSSTSPTISLALLRAHLNNSGFNCIASSRNNFIIIRPTSVSASFLRLFLQPEKSLLLICGQREKYGLRLAKQPFIFQGPFNHLHIVPHLLSEVSQG